MIENKIINEQEGKKVIKWREIGRVKGFFFSISQSL